MRAKVGMKKDGTVTAVSGKMVVDTGYYSFATQAQVAVGCGEAQIMVRCPNWDLKPVIVCTNRSASGIVRGFGGQELKCVLIPLLCLAMEKAGARSSGVLQEELCQDPVTGTSGGTANWYTYQWGRLPKGHGPRSRAFWLEGKVEGMAQADCGERRKAEGSGSGRPWKCGHWRGFVRGVGPISTRWNGALSIPRDEHGTGQRSKLRTRW